MRIPGHNGDYVELELASVGPSGPPPSPDEDLLLIVVVRYGSFTGQADGWVAQPTWTHFVHELVSLEASRSGQARLASMSPDDFDLTLRTTDPAGHMGIEGKVGTRSNSHEATLRFGLIAIEPTALPEIIREIQSLSPRSRAE